MAIRADDPRLLAGLDEDWWENFEPPEGLRAEIIGGELVMTPSPGVPHARAATKLLVLFHAVVPEGLMVLQGLEWRTARQGRVASAPIPDLVVVHEDIERLDEPPVLAVEILSNSDRQRHSSGLTRIEVKREDYAAAGLFHYLEVDQTSAGVPVVIRFELDERRLIVAASAAGDEVLEAEAPFRYQIQPSSL
jgi:Uma2 family endonuclease